MNNRREGMSHEIDKKYFEYAASQLPYTTIFASQAFRAGYKEAQKEVEHKDCRKIMMRLESELTKKDAVIAVAVELLENGGLYGNADIYAATAVFTEQHKENNRKQIRGNL